MNLTELHWVALYNSKELGKLLISKGADFNTYDNFYQMIIV